jgi:hypothetical protein
MEKTESLTSRVIKFGKKAVIGTSVGTIIASPLMGKGWENNPNKPPEWAPPGWLKNNTPPPSPFAQTTQQAEYDAMIDYFLYEATPAEREMIVLEYGQEMPELYQLDELANQVQAMLQ